MLTTLAALPTSEVEITDTLDQITQGLSWMRVLYAILILVICLAISRIMLGLIMRAIERLKIDPSLHGFLRSSLRILFLFITVLIVADYLGVPISSLIATLGIVGLAVGLALQESLANLAGGIMVLVTKPFSVGDHIEVGSISGIVDEIGLVYTKVHKFDNTQIYVPNGEISTEVITNYTGQTTRRVDLVFGISYDNDVEVAKRSLREIIEAHPHALAEPAPYVRVSAYGDSSVSITLRAWCDTQYYWGLRDDLTEQGRVVLEKNGIELTYNHLNVHIMDKK